MACVYVAEISRSTSITAPIGFIFLPLRVLPFGVLFFVFGYCLLDLLDWIRKRAAPAGWPARTRGLIAVALIAWAGAEVTRGVLLVRTVNGVITMNEAELSAFLQDSVFRHNRFALGALAKNPNTTTELLDDLARMPSPALHERMD